MTRTSTCAEFLTSGLILHVESWNTIELEVMNVLYSMIIFYTSDLKYFLLHLPIQIPMFFAFWYILCYCLFVISMTDVFVESSAVEVVKYVFKKLLASKLPAFDNRKKKKKTLNLASSIVHSLYYLSKSEEYDIWIIQWKV